jgi:hypothetical protein
MAGVDIGDGTISIEYGGERRGRQVYHYAIDIPGFEYEGDDIVSGIGGGSLQYGLECLLSFLSAFAESRRYGNTDSDNWDLFPDELADWAMANSDEFSLLELELSESETALIEE